MHPQPDDMATLSQIEKATGIPAAHIVQASILGTLDYYRRHGTLSFLTQDTKTCHGCRFLKDAMTSPEGDPPPGKVIPFAA